MSIKYDARKVLSLLELIIPPVREGTGFNLHTLGYNDCLEEIHTNVLKSGILNKNYDKANEFPQLFGNVQGAED